ncbi:Ribosomal protein L7a [Giardia muris]|uniref:60S ribosomal protein L7a n=1 Tax=Giardia muris TaxID=5742 RepID=A0A4Z1SX13_GIAMU|nr:Ribosomal protein L7a [Giardia muris]|eukprot:TNJ30284.1 Ribosomal protein L7a [Giardia muris]
MALPEKKAARRQHHGRSKVPDFDLTPLVKWPKQVRIQRQKAVLKERLKVPPVINQFYNPVSKNLTHEILNFARKYSPETPEARKNRLAEAAKAKSENKPVPEPPKKLTVISGIRHVTGLIEKKKAKFVIIANDVDPIELVVWMPTLCHKMGIPYAIVRTKSELGRIVHLKKTGVLCFTDVETADKATFDKILQAVASEVDYEKAMKTYGGGVRGKKE